MTLFVANEAKDSLWVGEADAGRAIRTLFQDLETIIRFLNAKLPAEFAKAVSIIMMPLLSKRVVDDWLGSCIPSSLDAIPNYEKGLAQVKEFANLLDSMNWSGSQRYTEWVDSASKNWLAKRRDDAVHCVRIQVSGGIGTTRKATHIETGMVLKSEKLNIGLEKNGNTAESKNEAEDDWGAWDDDPEPSEQLSDEEHRKATSNAPGDDDVSAWEENWAFGEDDTTAAESETPQSGLPTTSNGGSKSAGQGREVTMSETYTISSIPPHLLKITIEVLEDAAKLSQEAYVCYPSFVRN